MFNWNEYYLLAQELAQRQEEAALRSAISRAYYATYCLARNALVQKGFAIPRTNTHKWVWDQFRNDPDAKLQKVGLDGDRLRRARNNADYDDLFQRLTPQVQSTMLTANGIL
jgi:uncharacterized protein (UPF0332 family)